MEVRLSEVNTVDQILIRTRFNDYSFRITDPNSCSGMLSGGALGTQPHHACLIGTIFPASDQDTHWKEIETGGHAVFLILGESMRRLTTSVIISIAVSAAPDSDTANRIAA